MVSTNYVESIFAENQAEPRNLGQVCAMKPKHVENLAAVRNLHHLRISLNTAVCNGTWVSPASLE